MIVIIQPDSLDRAVVRVPNFLCPVCNEASKGSPMMRDGVFQVKVNLALLSAFFGPFTVARSIIGKPQEKQTFLFCLPENLFLRKKMF